MMNQLTLLCLGVLSLSSGAIAQSDNASSNQVTAKTTKRAVKKAPAKTKALPQPSDIAEPKAKTYRSKSIQDSIPVKDRVSLSFYGFNGSEISAADQYVQLSYKVMPGMSFSIGTSLISPGDFHYGLIDFHANEQIAGLSPSFQFGYSGYEIDDGFTTKSDSGLLIGFGLSYPINQFSDLDFNIKSISSKVDVGDSEIISSLGVKINF